MRLFHRSFLAGFLFALPVTSSLADPPLRIGPVDGMTYAWRSVPNDIELPLGAAVQLEFSWGRNLADLNADGRVDLLDYATLGLCFSAPGGRQPRACEAGSYRAADLDADGDVDIDDANAFNRAMRDPLPFAVESVTWFGAHQISRTASRTRAELDLNEPGQHLIRVETTMTDPITQRTTRRSREITIHVVDASPAEITAAWTQEDTPAARGTATDPGVQMLVNAFHPSRPLNALILGDEVVFKVGVSVDPSYIAPNQTGGTGNRGLSTLVYDVRSPQAAFVGLLLDPLVDARSGFGVFGLAVVSSPFYLPSSTSVQAQYGGGWGFGRAGLPGGGDITTSIGTVIAAGIAAPLTFSADVNPNFPGLQPNSRLDVGAGLYTFPPDDLRVGGLQGGFGQNLINIAPGDGTWFFQSGVIDTTGWPELHYEFQIIPTAGALFNGTLDYSQDFGGAFRVEVPREVMSGVSFSFTIGTPDCNANGVPDDQDIAQGTSADCTSNTVPDECDIAMGVNEDCNNNAVPDECDLDATTSQDCNDNSIPDECEPNFDCNANNIQDICDIAAGTSQDCNDNAIPDECEPGEDCNANSVPDICDIAAGTSQDCQLDQVPDECQLAENDCNANALPDECEPVEDCNANSVQDICDIAAGTSQDCNSNVVPDECEPNEDCNANSVQDICDIAAGTSQDCNSNSILDECESAFVNQQAKLLPADGATLDRFGGSVAISGDTIVVGARLDDDNGNNSGSAYVFVRRGTSWNQQAKLLPSDGAGVDFFGGSVAISDDTIVIGALGDDDNLQGSGSAYVFLRAGTSWNQQAKLLPSDGAGVDHFGESVAISGNTIVVGAYLDDDNGVNSGSAYVFVRSGTSWSQHAKLLPSDGAASDLFGFSVSISGDTIVVDASKDDDNGEDSGSAYVFEKPPLGWSDMTQTAKLLPADGAANDLFGFSVAISADTIVIGATGDNDNGDRSGSAYVFVRSGTSWSQHAKLLPSDGAASDLFGWSVAISDDTIVAGARWNDDNGVSSGSAYVFEKPPLGWLDMTETAKILPCDGAPGDFFGTSVAISGERVVVGAWLDDDNGDQSGSAYVFGSQGCNGNGIHDKFDIAQGTSQDCNDNAVPDECDIAEGTAEDCNSNGIPDECDIAAGTSTDCNGNDVPDECENIACMDIKPGSCPNSFNRNSHGVLPVSLIGTPAFGVSHVDLSTVLLSRADGVGGTVAPHEGPPGPQTVTEDVATPFDGESCECHALTADGFIDLSMKFKTDELVPALELDTLSPGALVELTVSGNLFDGTAFSSSDCVRLVPPGTGPGVLAVNSNLPQAWIDIAPLDKQLDGGGFGQFERTWPQSTVVTLSAEEFYLGQRFVGWKFNDQFLSREMTAAVTVIEQPQTVDALFRRAGDITGDDLINLNDFALFAVCFGKSWGSNLSGACSNEALASADLDRNGVIDLRDFAIFAVHFGT